MGNTLLFFNPAIHSSPLLGSPALYLLLACSHLLSSWPPGFPVFMFVPVPRHTLVVPQARVKWALGSITMNKASGGDRIPVELFQILKDDAVKMLHSICQQIWKTQQWPQDWKNQFSFQSQRKAMPKNAQTTAQLHSSHTLVK